MKTYRLIAAFAFVILIIICIMFGVSIRTKKETQDLKAYNSKYEVYLNKIINGTELATLINKAVNENEKNNVEKNSKNHYIDNGINSIKIEVRVELTKKTYQMEEFFNNDTSKFVEFFANEKFLCTNIEYHNKTGKISKIFFTQVEE